MTHLPDRIKFEMNGDLIVVDRNGPTSFTAKLYQRSSGGGFETKPLVRATGITRTKAAVQAVKMASCLYSRHAMYGQECRHDEVMGPVWLGIESEMY